MKATAIAHAYRSASKIASEHRKRTLVAALIISPANKSGHRPRASDVRFSIPMQSRGSVQSGGSPMPGSLQFLSWMQPAIAAQPCAFVDALNLSIAPLLRLIGD